MTVLPDLEQQLIDAAQHAIQPETPRGGRVRAGAGGIGIATAVGTAIVIAIGILSLLGSHKPTSPQSAARPGRQQLIDIIGALRRPQTSADLNQSILAPLEHRPLLDLQGDPDLPLVRFATRTPWGERLYFVPMAPPTAKQIAVLNRRFPSAHVGSSLRDQGETLSLFSSQGGGGAGDAESIQAGRAIETEGAGRSFAGGSTQTRFILVVPDGVAKVEFVLPRQPQPGVPQAPIYRHSSTVTVPVHDNIAAVQVAREFDGGSPPMIWFAADGRVLRRIGNFDDVNRVVAPPKAGPETPLSRAAERDPSTPNRVWVTPAVGGPQTSFMLHFRLLLTNADYRYGLTGTRCPAITLNGGDGGGGARGLRGRIWSDVVDAVAGQTWCPGAYHLTASVMDLGGHGRLKHPAKPFGSATFTVRR